MNRFVAIAVVVVAMPFVVGLARASFGPQPTPTKAPKELTAVAEPGSLGRRYGVAVVPMPDPPDIRYPISDGRLADGRSADGRLADNRLPIADRRAIGFVCPDVRAIVSGDSPFAVVAWGETSQVVTTARTATSPSGDVIVRRITAKSITFAKADTTLQCKLLVR